MGTPGILTEHTEAQDITCSEDIDLLSHTLNPAFSRSYCYIMVYIGDASMVLVCCIVRLFADIPVTSDNHSNYETVVSTRAN